MRKKTPGAAESHNLSILLQRCFPWPQGPKNPQDDVQTPRRSIENPPVSGTWMAIPRSARGGSVAAAAACGRRPCTKSCSRSVPMKPGARFRELFHPKKNWKKKTWDFWSFERKVEFFEALTKKHFGILAIVWYCLDWDLTINLICCNFTDKQIAMSAINNVRRESR